MMKRFVIAGFALLLTTAAVVPAAEAKTPNNSLADTTLQQRRLLELDERTKSAEPLNANDDANYSFTQDLNSRRDSRDK